MIRILGFCLVSQTCEIIISTSVIKIFLLPSLLKGFFIELPKLIQPTVPTVEVLLEVNQVYRKLFNKLKVELALVQFHFVLWQVFHPVVLENLRHEVILLISFFLHNLEYYFPHFVNKFVGLLSIVLIRVLKERC